MDSMDLYSKNFEPGISLANVINQHISTETIHLLSHTESNNDSERQSLNDLENLKYKTELCRNYSTYGYCSYSTRCQFAHGHEELRSRNRHPKYKTELCRNFLSGFCKYGSRCQFLHHTNEFPTTTVTALSTYLLTNILAQSAALGIGGSALAATLAAYVNTPIESCLKRSCGIEMQQNSHHFYGLSSIPQNQNNNDSQSITEDIDLTSEKLQRIRKFSISNDNK